MSRSSSGQVGVKGRGRPADEDGFTLVELVLSVTIMVVVVGSLSMALLVAMRSTTSAGERPAPSR